ncbi:glycosyltransferase family 4 protein [Gillisia sp. M10.2A]|uniref:Glycosyltransferase family 4 protein n=1 Tax=Gillisia lutea TaxID=2909668 RepID=A0ABS9EF80_9FLAO|nr:glycosyltransferase [Gillisia lutea]MCF4101528.1 glycosyltransferase family 4 protein [Gillisia lutea]
MKSLLVIGYVWPEPNSSAAGARMMQLLDFFLLQNYKITFASTAAKTIHMANLEEMDINSINIELNNSSFDDFISALAPDIVLFDRFMMEEQFGWRVTKICPNSIKILDTEDLHFLRKHRELEFKALQKNQLKIKDSELAKREIASIYRCDLSLIISKQEMQLLITDFEVPINLLIYIPFLFDKLSENTITELPKYEEREHFVSIGNFRHFPNYDAVLYLKKEIWPLINKELPRAQMHVYGAYPSQKVTQLNAPRNNFFIKGWTKNAQWEVKNAKVSLAPLRFGAGLKGKLTEAMLCGTPNVTTSLGAEGMHGELGWNGYIENAPVLFAQAAIALYTKPDIWKEAQLRGFDIINQLYDKIPHQERLKLKIEELFNTLQKHRTANFTGAMLNQHRNKSTYFLSKFIEVKNELEQLRAEK